MRVSFLGTGLMGRPMAERLLDGGYEVTVYNRTREKALPLAEKGARIAESAREAVAAGECTVIMLKDAGAIRRLLEGDGKLPDLTGRTIVQMSTISSAESMALMEDVRRAGGEYLEAPVLGSTPQAQEGSLLVLVGAAPEQFERWRDLLGRFGPEPRRIGPVGHAATLKLAINQLIGSLAAAFSLSLGMVRRAGIDVDGFLEILRKSAFYAPTFDRKLPNMLARDFSNPNFPAALLLKDVDLILAEAGGSDCAPRAWRESARSWQRPSRQGWVRRTTRLCTALSIRAERRLGSSPLRRAAPPEGLPAGPRASPAPRSPGARLRAPGCGAATAGPGAPGSGGARSPPAPLGFDG